MLNKLITYKYKKWFTLLGGFIINMTLGSLYTFGNIIPYMISYLREYDNIDVRYASATWIGLAASLALSFGGALAGFFNSVVKLRLKTVILLGCVVLRFQF
jgi:hypothetical protein